MKFEIRSGELEQGLNFIDIYEDNINIATAEIDFSNDRIFLENIVRDSEYSGKGILKQFIKYCQDNYHNDIICLPLEKYRTYYQQLGFKVYMISENHEDVFYKLTYINS